MRVWVLMFTFYGSERTKFKRTKFIGVFESELESLKVARKLEKEFDDVYGNKCGYWNHYNTIINEVWP